MERWEPFRNLADIQGEVNRLLDDFFGRPPRRPAAPGEPGRRSSTWTRRRTISS
jgi:hypothetical protein